MRKLTPDSAMEQVGSFAEAKVKRSENESVNIDLILLMIESGYTIAYTKTHFLLKKRSPINKKELNNAEDN